MRESRQDYSAIVGRERITLEWALGHALHHLDRGYCPHCGASGHFDLDGLGFSYATDNPIYFSTVFQSWCCRACDYRMIA